MHRTVTFTFTCRWRGVHVCCGCMCACVEWPLEWSDSVGVCSPAVLVIVKAKYSDWTYFLTCWSQLHAPTRADTCSASCLALSQSFQPKGKRQAWHHMLSALRSVLRAAVRLSTHGPQHRVRMPPVFHSNIVELADCVEVRVGPRLVQIVIVRGRLKHTMQHEACRRSTQHAA